MQMFKFLQKRRRDADIEELQLDIIELRALLNKTLVTVNKQLRAHGRTAQAIEASNEKTPATRRSGLITPYGSNRIKAGGAPGDRQGADLA